jgi:eukaryotic-like serine/threonine-protein kinase
MMFFGGFAAFIFYAYDKTALDSKIELTDESSPHWRKEKVTFNAAYGNEKVTGYLFLPKKISPPYQTIIYFPGANAIQERSLETYLGAGAARLDIETLEVILQSGRAFFYPVYKGTFERKIGLTSTRPNPTSAHRDFIIQVAKDFQRSVDYLETRKDIDHDRLGYLGLSWGARLGTQLLALDDRVKAGVLIMGGLSMGKAYPEVDQINFVTRIKVPILMLNGKYDPVFAVKESQIPMFQLLATPAKDKRHVIYELGHRQPPRNELEKEIPSWFDRYLGPVK